MSIDRLTEEVYEWLELYSFDELEANQQEVVRQCIDEESYNEMHEAFNALLSVKTIKPVRGKAQIKQEIFANVVDDESDNQVIGIWSRTVSLGKAAAVVLFLGSVLVWSLMRQPKEVLVNNYETAADTVYLTKEVAVPNFVHDTVFVAVKPITPSPKKGQFRTQKNISPESSDIPMPGIHIASANEINRPSNQSKNNSFKHDSLAKKFGFVSL